MADHWIKKDGAWKKLNDTEFQAEFGYLPTTPRQGETSFGGRYEHASYISGSIDSNLGQVPSNREVVKNPGNTSFAGLEVGSGSST
tara:strand:+ start:282 stop:539 length:258 start_codon:yes stop_codon:yes gene_type:complete